MTRTQRLAHLVRADFLERVRRHGFLVTLLVTLWFAYVFLPPNGARYVTMQIAGHRGLYGSAWVGAATSLLGGTFLSLIGFYLVKNSIERDRVTGVGEILATTALSKPLYTLGKAASNFTVLAALASLLAAGALGMQLLRGEDTRVDLVALLAPFIVITLPTLMITSGLAVLFESVKWLRGGLGNIAYFFTWAGLTVGTTAARKDVFSGVGDFLGASAVLPSMLHAVADAFPGVDRHNAPMSLGFNFSNEAVRHVDTFRWEGPHWTAAVLAARLTWAAMGVVLALVASIPFDRFDTVDASARSRSGRGPRAGASPTAAPVPGARHVSAAELRAARRAASFLPLLRGELTLMVGRLPWAWWAIALGLVIACVFVPLGVARGYVLPLAWIWPMLAWSPLGARESIHRTEALMFSSPRPLMRQLAATWTAGALVAFAAGLGVGVRLLAAGDVVAAVAWTIGGLFIPTLALACGTWTGNGRMFEVVYLLLWYAGPMNHLPALDFAATGPATISAGAPARFAIATLALAIAAVLGRARRLRG